MTENWKQKKSIYFLSNFIAILKQHNMNERQCSCVAFMHYQMLCFLYLSAVILLVHTCLSTSMPFKCTLGQCVNSFPNWHCHSLKRKTIHIQFPDSIVGMDIYFDDCALFRVSLSSVSAVSSRSSVNGWWLWRFRSIPDVSLYLKC